MTEYERGRADLIKEIKQQVAKLEQQTEGVDIVIDILFLLKRLK